MDIKCPKCSTSYKVPDSKISDKPRKMRCTRCKEVFAVTRRDQNTPDGYEEFTGRHAALPGEFAFLRETSWRKRSDVPPEKPNDTASPPPPPAEAVAPSVEESIVDKVLREATKKSDSDAPPPAAAPQSPQAPPTSPPQPTVPDVPQQIEPAVAEEHIEPAVAEEHIEPAVAEEHIEPAVAEEHIEPAVAEEQIETAAVTPPADPVVAVSASDNIPEMYSASAWEMEDPLDLESFAVQEGSPNAQLVGKIATVFIVSVAAFLFFVTYRNGWTLSLFELPEQTAFAFSDKEREVLPNEVNGIETTMDETKIILRKKKGPLLVVTGTIFNNNPVKRSHIILRGRLVDGEGKTRFQVRSPCDKVFEENKLKKAPKGEVARLYRKAGKLHNCTISGESSTIYQIVFDNLPADYDESFSVEVTTIAARSTN